MPDIGEEEIQEVVDTLRSGWLSTGPKTRQFESDFESFLGDGLQAVAVNSATAGLHLALEALEVGPGDEVITTTHTFTATAEVVRYLGADPVFVDIDLSTFCIDVGAIETLITPRTKVLLPVHYGGLSCDMDGIHSLAEQYGLNVVEDAAHAFPCRYKGKLIGSLNSDATVFSFYATKTIATGEGGMLVTRNHQLAQRARTMRLHGIDRDAFDRYTASRPFWYYEVVAPGFKYNMTDIAASLGIHQLRRAELFRERREELAANYDSSLQGLPLVLPPHASRDDQHAWHLYVPRLSDDVAVSRDDIVHRLYEHGIGCSVHYIPLHRQPYWRENYHLRPEDFLNSEKLYGSSFSLPIYTKMSDADQERVVAALWKVLK
jgi:dTDP-4-amino-4,6-dideoxygalactose transaminase